MRMCARVTRFVQWVENELRDLPTYEGLPNLVNFLTEFEGLVTKSQCLSMLDHVLKAMPTRWWGVHKLHNRLAIVQKIDASKIS